MENKIIFSFIIILTLFLTISSTFASENITDDEICFLDDNSSAVICEGDVDNEYADDVVDENNKSTSEISAEDVVSYTDYKDEFTVTLTSNNTTLSNRSVLIVLNNVTYNKTTGENGQANIDFKLKAGNYSVSFYFEGDENYTSCNGTATIIIKPDIITSLKVADKDINYRVGSNSIFQLRLLDVNNNPISGKKVKITVCGETYTAKTNSKGYATFYLKNLKKGNQTIEYSFSKDGDYLSCNGSFSITVKPKLTKGNGYWVNKWDMYKVNLKKLSKKGTKHIFLLHTAFDKYGETKVLKWIKKAHKYGIKVHIWISVFYKNGKYLHPSDKNGVYNYNQMNKIIRKAKYYASFKEVDGIQFDYLRFGGNAYKYKNGTQAINYFVKTACKSIRQVNSNIIISSTVMPEPNGMKYYYGQDLPTISKYLDVVMPMLYKGNYHASSKWIKKTTKQFVKKSNGAKIWSGLQTYKSDWNIKKLSYKSLLKDAKAAKKGGASGIVLFRWGLSQFLNFKKV